ncbi:MAG: helix-turn-helix domain-containing protein, partial [Nitrospira sp.]|nr:helix-turn-helix domain-containing protein [Nitrospira sp.]
MEGFGKFLQEARERKRLSLEDVASQTRIQPKYLEALESENFG